MILKEKRTENGFETHYLFEQGKYIASITVIDKDPIWGRPNLNRLMCLVYAKDDDNNPMSSSAYISDTRFKYDNKDVSVFKRFGFVKMNAIPYDEIGSESPQAYQEIKAILGEMDAWIRGNYPGYCILHKEDDPQDPRREIVSELAKFKGHMYDQIAYAPKECRKEIREYKWLDLKEGAECRKEMVKKYHKPNLWQDYQRAIDLQKELLEKYEMSDLFQ